MTIKVIRKIEHYTKRLGYDLKKHADDIKLIRHWIAKIKNTMRQEYRLEVSTFKFFGGKEKHFPQKLYEFILKELEIVKSGNIENSIQAVENIESKLDAIIDVREIRDKRIIPKVVHPYLKKLGYKKKARVFIKDDVKINVYTSKTGDWYDLDIRFEVTYPKKRWDRKIITNVWHKINQDTNIKKLEKDVLNDLKKVLEIINE